MKKRTRLMRNIGLDFTIKEPVLSELNGEYPGPYQWSCEVWGTVDGVSIINMVINGSSKEEVLDRIRALRTGFDEMFIFVPEEAYYNILKNRNKVHIPELLR